MLLKSAVSWTHVISDLNSVEIVGKFYKKEFPETNRKEFSKKKEIERKDDKIYDK